MNQRLLMRTLYAPNIPRVQEIEGIVLKKGVLVKSEKYCKMLEL